jgi:hypothetical protein
LKVWSPTKGDILLPDYVSKLTPEERKLWMKREYLFPIISGGGSEQFTVTTGLVSLAASATRVAIQLATNTTTTNIIIGFDVSFDSIATGAGAVPIRVELVRESTVSSTTGAAFTPTKFWNGGRASNTTARINDTADGTVTVIIKSWLVSPTGGFSYQFPLGREIQMGVSEFVALRLISQSGMTTCNYEANLDFEE